MTDPVGQRFGNYELIHILGRGGFADVYLARHLYLQSLAAIKLLHTRLRSRDREHFLHEARTLVELKHPHILQILDFGEEQNIPYLVMMYAEHGTLRQRYHNNVLPLNLVCTYIGQAASALQYAHDHKIIHRDIKPENMLLDRDESLLLSDFGIALPSQSSHWQSDASIAGTAAYMAPEQIQGKSRRASDQYALAVVAYEWLAGETPFHGSFKELASQHLFMAPPSLRAKDPRIVPEVEKVILQALAKEPDARFATVEAFALALAAAAGATNGAGAVPQRSTLLPHSSLPPTVAAAQRASPSGYAPTQKASLPPTLAAAQHMSASGYTPMQRVSSALPSLAGRLEGMDTDRKSKGSEPLSPETRSDIITTMVTALDPLDHELSDLEEEDVNVGLISLTCWLSVYACLLGFSSCVGIFLASSFWPAEAIALGVLNLLLAPSAYISTRHRTRTITLFVAANVVALLLALSLRSASVTDAGGIAQSLFTGLMCGLLATGTYTAVVFPLFSGSRGYLLRKLPRIIGLDSLMIILWVALWIGGSYIGEPVFIAQHAQACLWSTVTCAGVAMLIIAKGWTG